MARVIVTGASGFVGSRLVPMLVESGHNVIATSRQHQNCAAIEDSAQYEGAIDWRKMSTESSDHEWQDLFQEAEFVIHLAARVHIMREDKQSALPAYMKANTDFTKRIATIAEKRGVSRFVFVSTIKVLGEKTNGQPFVASSKENPQDPYSVSKYLAEKSLRQICATGKMGFVIVRPTLVIGDNASGNLERLIKWVASGIPFFFGGVSNRRSLVSVETLCQILIRSLENPAVANRTILAADPDAVSTPDIVRALACGYGKSVRVWAIPQVLTTLLGKLPVAGSAVARLSESLIVDPSETYDCLGWTPNIPINERLRIVGERYRTHGD